MIQKLQINNFKNITLNIELSSGINVISAMNGKGKTNLLESIYFIVNGFLFRKTEDEDLINWQFVSTLLPAYFGIKAIFKNEERNIFYEKGKRKIFQINGKNRLSEIYSKQFSAIIFAPQTIDLITGSPSLRREEIDTFIIQKESQMIKVYEDYRKVIRNKNKLLSNWQNLKSDFTQLNFWNQKVVEFGSQIIQKRIKSLQELEKVAAKIAKEIYHFEDNIFKLIYISKIETDEVLIDKIQSSFSKKLQESISKETAVRESLYGPHRDDIEVKLNGIVLKKYGSRGQQRIASFIIKMAENELLKILGKEIIILLDDLPSELDNEHIIKIEKFLKSLENQIVITAVHKEEFDESFLKDVKIFEL